MPKSRQEATLEELKKALRKVAAYDPHPKAPQKTFAPKTQHRLSTKKRMTSTSRS